LVYRIILKGKSILLKSDIDLKIGTRILIKNKKKEKIGLVFKKEKKDGNSFEFEILDNEPLYEESELQIVDTLKDLYQIPYNIIFQNIFPKELFLTKEGSLRKVNLKNIYIFPNLNADISIFTKKQKEAYLFLKEEGKVLKKEFLKKYSLSLLKNLEKKGAIFIKEEDKVYEGLKDIKESVSIKSYLEDKNIKVLIGNYLKIFESFLFEALNENKNFLFIFPDIISAHHNFEKYKNILKNKLFLYSRLLSLGERQNTIKKLTTETGKILFTTPFGSFLPIKNLEKIFIFEDESPNYIQKKFPYLDYFLVSYLRSKYRGIDIKIISSSPKLTNYYFFLKDSKVEEIEFREEKRKISFIDLKKEKNLGKTALISKSVLKLISLALKNRENLIIFYNKKGYDTHIVCPECGKFPKCNACGIPLVYSRKLDILFCPVCKKKYKKVEVCPNCKVNLKFYGVGIEKVYDFLKRKFNLKDKDILIFESFLLKTKGKLENLLRSLKEAKIILSVYNYFLSSYLPNFKYGIFLLGEKSIYSNSYEYFEGIYNAIKSAFYKVDRLYIQTFFPRLYPFKYLNEPYEKFFSEEILFRQEKEFPPYLIDIDIFYYFKEDEINKVKQFSKEFLEPILTYIKKYSQVDKYSIPKQNEYFIYYQKVFFEKKNLRLITSYLFSHLNKFKDIRILYKLNNPILAL